MLPVKIIIYRFPAISPEISVIADHFQEIAFIFDAHTRRSQPQMFYIGV